MATLGAGAFIGAMGILASALGGNTKIETNDYEDKQQYEFSIFTTFLLLLMAVNCHILKHFAEITTFL